MIVLDIETIPTDDAEMISQIASTITHPKSMSKADTIAKWEAEDKPGLIVDAVSKTAFDGTYGRICCIGWAIDDKPPVSLCGTAEANILASFMTAVREATSLYSHTFVGHNIASFDLRFMWQRCIINRVKPSTSIPFNAKPWDKAIGDTMIMWNPERERRIGLDRLCKVLGVKTPKHDLDGSKVNEAFQAGEYDRISAYCRDDVAATRECYMRMLGN